MDINQFTNKGLQALLCDKFFVTGFNAFFKDAM